jgi:PTH1 family peptidyl-tRNA hydrolase
MGVDRFCDERRLPEWREKFSGVYTRGDDVMVLKPMTFMNVSGDSVQPAAAFVKVEPANVVVLHDELDLPWGDVRLKLGGGHAGHNGLRSIIGRLGTPDFVRVRIGIGRPPPGFRGEVADFVLQDFDSAERAELPDVLARAVSAVNAVIEKGFAAAQNVVNTRK